MIDHTTLREKMYGSFDEGYEAGRISGISTERARILHILKMCLVEVRSHPHVESCCPNIYAFKFAIDALENGGTIDVP